MSEDIYAADKKIKAITQIIQDTDNVLRREFSNASDFTRVIFLGSSGAAKSTIANSIIGKTLQIKENEYGNIYLDAYNPPFPMGNQMISTTTVPNIYSYHEHSLLLCDAPGFDDNRGSSQDIVNSFAIDQLFREPNKIKILYVFSASEASIEGGRAYKVAKNLLRISQIIPDKDELFKSIAIIITRGDGRSPEKYLKQLIDQNPDKDLVSFVNFLIQNANERVFSFNNASREHIGENYNFSDRERLLRFLHDSPVHNPKHKVILSSDARCQLLEACNDFGNVDILFNDLIMKIEHIYLVNNDDYNDLLQLKDSITQIQQNLPSIHSPIKFVEKVEQIIKINQTIEETLSKIRCFDSILSFISNVDGCIVPLQLQQFDQKIKEIIDKEIIKIDTMIKQKEFEKDLADKQNQLDEFRIQFEQKEKERKVLEANIAELKVQMKDKGSKSKEQILELQNKLNKMSRQLDAIKKKESFMQFLQNAFNSEAGKQLVETGTQYLISKLQDDNNSSNNDAANHIPSFPPPPQQPSIQYDENLEEDNRRALLNNSNDDNNNNSNNNNIDNDNDNNNKNSNA